GCARRGDSLGASAPPVSHWLLIEHQGPWGTDALFDSDLPPEVVEAVVAQAAVFSARVLLIRRPGRAVPGPRRWAFVDSRPGREGSWWSSYDDPAELADLGLTTRKGTYSTEPIYLVCTHGRHDACCAIRGRPVAAALSLARPGATWECSHVGGDRFAANLLALPHGFYFGQVSASDAPGTAADYEAGLVDLPRLRGRSTFAAPVQAAQQFARELLGERGVDSLAPRAVHRIERELWKVDLQAADSLLSVQVRARFHRSDSPLTCSADVPAAIRHFELVAID
ncbi:MAG: sucrase ferredoxin, partial [Actinomycetota bacterium]|nr:sucrase ferredoxin [Actinomycetota bacterium]